MQCQPPAAGTLRAVPLSNGWAAARWLSEDLSPLQLRHARLCFRRHSEALCSLAVTNGPASRCVYASMRSCGYNTAAPSERPGVSTRSSAPHRGLGGGARSLCGGRGPLLISRAGGAAQFEAAKNRCAGVRRVTSGPLRGAAAGIERGAGDAARRGRRRAALRGPRPKPPGKGLTRPCRGPAAAAPRAAAARRRPTPFGPARAR